MAYKYFLIHWSFHMKQVINCIWKHPAASVVYLTCDLLGQEDILANVSQAFGSKIFVDNAANPEFFGALTLTVPDILTKDPTSRFHVFDGFPNLYKRAAAKLAEAEANSQLEPLIVRASAQWYACDEEYSCTGSEGKLRFDMTVKDQFGVWHICYSMHSSNEELEWALQLLAPRWVASTTPECPAMELDYVKKYCLANRLTAVVPLWKLLDICVETSSSQDMSTQGAANNPMVEEPVVVLVQSPKKLKEGSSRLLHNLPLYEGPIVTLFGRARLRIEESFFLPAEKIQPREDKYVQVVQDKVEKELKVEKVNEKKKEIEKVNKVELSVTEGNLEGQRKDASSVSHCANVGSSSTFGENLKRYYRSMNVPVPRPLP